MKQCLFFSIFLSFVLAIVSCVGVPRTSAIIGKSVLQSAAAGQTAASQNLIENRTSHSATLLPDGKVIFIGGMENDSVFYDDAEIFNPDGNNFILLKGRMHTARAGHTATLLPDGKILVAGGWSKPGTAEATAELYDPQADSFAETGSMRHRRAGHTAVSLEDGKVLVVGGVVENNAENQNDAEVYDPKSKTFSSAGKMSRPRGGGYSATALKDGRVLVAGGSSGGGRALPDAEIFPPLAEMNAPEGADQTTSYRRDPALLGDGGVLIFGGASYLIVR